MIGILIGGIIWAVTCYLIICLPFDREIKKLRKENEKRKIKFIG